MGQPQTENRWSPADRRCMDLALRLARRGTGYTEPNPLVGAVVARGPRILACGWHRAFGAPHAEAMALAGVDAAGATLYVTLEPCDHHGKTPPCSELIVAKKLRRVVVAMRDPNPLVDGRGVRRLEAAGIRVEVGLLAERAAALNRHYLTVRALRRPYIAIHAGMSLDGKLTDRHGASQWMTSELSRRLSHGLRGEFSAILAGANTVRRDNPQLTLREPGWPGKTLRRIVFDSRNTLDRGLRVFRGQKASPLLLFSAAAAAGRGPRAANHFFVPEDEYGLSLAAIGAVLFDLGVTSVLVEGGGRVINSFLAQQLYDELVLFISPRLVGGRESVELYAAGAESLAAAHGLHRAEWHDIGDGFILRGGRACSPVSY